MSESIPASTNTNVGVEGQQPQSSEESAFDQIGKQVGADEEQDGFAPNDDNPDDDPDGSQDDEDDGEEKIALKVNGKTVHKTQKEVVELAQKYEATSMKLETAKKEITEAREMKAKYTSQSDAIKQLLNVMQNGDINTIHEFVDERLNGSQAFNKGVIEYVLQLWEHSKMSPEQKEAMENKKQLTKLRAQHEQQQKTEAQRAHEYEVNQWSQHINVEVPKALKEIGLPDSEFIRSQIISTWRAAMERGQTPTALAVANYVKSQLDASKLNYGGNPTKVAPMPVQTRPKATVESVGRKMNGKAQETGYADWDTWKANRGR